MEGTRSERVRKTEENQERVLQWSTLARLYYDDCAHHVEGDEAIRHIDIRQDLKEYENCAH
jgi:hypothetical protein